MEIHKHSINPRIFFSIFAAILPTLILFGAAELLIRLIDPNLNGFKAIYFAGDKNTPVLFINDPILHWRLRPNTNVKFLNNNVQVNKHGFRGNNIQANKKLILFMGDSTTFGWKLPEESTFSYLVEQKLNKAEGPLGQWQSINAGVPGYTSHQTMLLAQEILKNLRVEYLILCVGNNEAWPAKKTDSQIYNENCLKSHVIEFLSYSKFLLWAKELIRPQAPKRFIAGSMADSKPRVSKHDYISNIKRIVSIARKHQVKVIILSPPVNLLYPPLRLDLFQDSKASKKNWSQIRYLIRTNQDEKAISRVNKGLLKNPDRFDLLWLSGFLLIKRGEVEKGKAFMEEAFEKHPFPERSKLSYRNALKKYASQNQIEYLDVNKLFNPKSDRYGSNLYMDWCHPTRLGHKMIANELSKLIFN